MYENDFITMDLPQLASILRDNGDKVLNAESKLSLSTTLLKDLNDSFNLIVDEREALNSTFQVIGTSSSKIELLFDLQFLHDFIQRTVSLKLSPEGKYEQTQVDIRKFKNLKLLELRKIPISDVIGLQCLRTQLQYLICCHCIDNLKELFIDCGGDKSERYVWNELKEVILSYNNLTTIDSSLEYVPWLQSLDLSHNRLVNVQAIDCLANLKHLNLSYNQLEAVPLFNKELSRKLQVLVLKNNYIEDLTGLILLDDLITLDLSFNCLVDHQSLLTLPYLSTLQWLSLEGNPLSFHLKHRSLTASRLHRNTLSVQFLLDGLLLSKTERAQVGTHKSNVTRHPATPRTQLDREHLSSVSSSASINTYSSEITTIAASLTRSQSKKAGKIRNAIIAESDDTGEIIEDELVNSVTSIESMETSMEHLETKKQIEILRKQYGEQWLQSVGGSLVQDVLGIPKTEIPIMSSSPYEADFKIHAAEVLKPETNQDNKDDKADVISELSANNTFVTASESSLFEDNERTVTSDYEEYSDNDQSEGGEEQLYLVHIKHKEDELEESFLLITNDYIKEKDVMNGHVKFKWQREVLINCELITNDPPTILVEYDTVRRNLKQRQYVLSEEDATQFLSSLNDIISKRSPQKKEINFSCMKCSFKFKINTKSFSQKDKLVPECPSCHSTIVYELDDSSPSITIKDRPKSPSECSIGSAASVQESNSSVLSIDDTVTPDSHIYRRYESDIEVISNPSQSSIEVLDDTRPGRKRSSEERKIFTMPTIPDVVNIINTLPVVLTESSSSSSFTESICTAYDTHKDLNSQAETGLEVTPIQEEIETSVGIVATTEKNKTGLITSIIDGLFTGAKEGTKSVPLNNSNGIEFEYSENFSNVDHRIKLHLYQHIFEDEHEDFLWLLRCSLLSYNSTEIIPACLVLSTQKVYTLHIKNHNNGDDIIGWLIKKDSYTIDRLQTVFSLPWKQGIGIDIRTIGKNTISHLCVLQDMQYTTNFLAFLAINPLPDSCDLVTTMPERSMMNLQQSLISRENPDSTIKSTNVCLLSIFSNCTVSNNTSTEMKMGIFMVTNTDLILVQDLTWLMPDSNNIPVFKFTQPISNLLELESEENTVEFHFLDEVGSYEEIWCMHCATENSMNTVISAVRTPWEQIFSVPLQVNHKVHIA